MTSYFGIPAPYDEKHNSHILGNFLEKVKIERLLIPSCKSNKLQLAVEQSLTAGCWNPPKKDTQSPKTKKKLQQDGKRGTNMIKSNHIPSGWATHDLENSNTKEILP